MREVQIIDGQRPPNFEDIAAVFPGAHGDYVIFAYGEQIFNPSGKKLPDELLEHELVHCERQQEMGVDEWWEKYLTDGDFRYEEELLAHRAEYHVLCVLHEGRANRRKALTHVAKKLCAPLYGRIVTLEKAKRDIKS